MRIAICDDEQADARKLVTALTKICDERGLAVEAFCFSDAQDLLNEVKSRSGVFDLYLLDIEMPMKRGTTLSRELRQIDPACKVMFVTSHGTEIFSAFHYKADAFIPKGDLERHLADELDHFIAENQNVMRPQPHFFEVAMPTGTRYANTEVLICVKPNDILYFESRARQVLLHAVNATYQLLKMPYLDVVARFHDMGFLEVHRCFLVNYWHIHAIGKQDVIMDNGEQVNMSRRRRPRIIAEYMNMVRDI